ncbi:DUF616 domain-containing protein [Algoriphagus sp. C2-6-M1]|uniref:glycosyltransferase domain-containing protein n=1 Tax=Algoriphagus persicinus TaxID=3108754 RepID=UPI002B37E592|nr:glycosyltransferase domain-containing protein [Algoriphagus sp. C2-6-M1]MEB2782747.1 DUF616 domain-containing protein [Algoriphagus sp. C2-6-M1]
MPNSLIYSIVTNNYDHVKPAPKYPGFDFWLFTDQEGLEVEGWEVFQISKSTNPIKQQRLIKINSCKYTPSYELTIYIDGNMELIRNPIDLLKKHYSGGFMTTCHPKRSTLVAEGMEIVRKKKDLEQNVAATLEFARQVGFADDMGLYETGVLIRDKSKGVAILEKKWSELLEEYSHRDQLTLPIALHLTGEEITSIPRSITFHYVKMNRGHRISLKFNSGKKGWLSKMIFKFKKR